MLPMNIMPKHEGQATVASREPQYWHSGASVDVAAPHIGQLSVSACILGILAGGLKLDYKTMPVRCWRRPSLERERKVGRKVQQAATPYHFRFDWLFLSSRQSGSPRSARLGPSLLLADKFQILNNGGALK